VLSASPSSNGRQEETVMKKTREGWGGIIGKISDGGTIV
jgi:hypothetical protein